MSAFNEKNNKIFTRNLQRRAEIVTTHITKEMTAASLLSKKAQALPFVTSVHRRISHK
jgi:hypothetical protein